MGKVCVYAMNGVLESNAAKGMPILLVERHAELGKRFARIGHQTLAAGLIDRVGPRLHQRTVNPAPAQSDSSRESGGATSNDQDFSCHGRREASIRHFG
jgi:hypothetical protein